MTRRLLFVGLVAVAACTSGPLDKSTSATGSLSGRRSDGPVALSEVEATAGMAAPGQATAPVAPNTAPDRMIVRNASMTLIVTDLTDVVRKTTDAVKGANGFIGESRQWRDGDHARARLTLRVPSAQLDPVLTSLRSWAVRVDNETVSGDDVTRQYVDLNAQLTNLRATEHELRELLVTVRQRAKKASEILEVHNELSRIRGEINQTSAEMQTLSQLSALSTITVDLVPDVVATPVAASGWQPLAVAHEAAGKLIGTVRLVAEWLIWIVIYVAPVGVVLWGLGWASLRTLRRLRPVT